MTIKKKLASSVVAFAFSAALAVPAAFADDATFEQFAVAAETSSVNVDFSHISGFTQAFSVEDKGRHLMSYEAISQQGGRFFSQYMRYLQSIPVSSLSRDDQLAYWLNTRNLLVIKAISESKSRRSLKSTRGTLAAPGKMWTEKRFNIGGTELSIQDIEQNIILANWKDPNVIYGLYQGTKDGPQFHPTGFTGQNVHAELERMGRKFVNSRSGVRVRKTSATISGVYDWYKQDLFDGSDEALTAHLAGLSDGKQAERFAAVTELKPKKVNYSVEQFVIRQQTAQPSLSGGGGGFSGGGGGS